MMAGQMRVDELIERLSEFPGHRFVQVGASGVSEVFELTVVFRTREAHGGEARDADVVVVIA